jgi:hypothetical protein
LYGELISCLRDSEHNHHTHHASSSSFSSLHALIVTVHFKEPLPSSQQPLSLLHYPHVIYNRGGDTFPSEYHTVTELSNVGREFFMHLKHLYLHYYHLPSLTIFGKYSHFLPEKKCPNLHHILSTKSNLSHDNDGFAFLGEGCGQETKIDSTTTKFHNSHEAITQLLGPNYLIKNSKYLKGSFFAVTREAVWRNTRTFYLELARRFASEDYSLHHETPQVMERLWPVIFQSHCLSDEVYHCLYQPQP